MDGWHEVIDEEGDDDHHDDDGGLYQETPVSDHILEEKVTVSYGMTYLKKVSINIDHLMAQHLIR